MNANELADAMQGVISVLNVHHEEDCLFIANDAQYMLRQQQAEIERLQRLCESYIRSDYEGTSMFQPFMEELYGKAREK